MKNKSPIDLKRITLLYLFTALVVLLVFRIIVKDDASLQYVGDILAGLITMFGIYYAFADSERTRDIENKPRFSAAVSPFPASADDAVNRAFVFFAGRPLDPGRHLRFTLHNEGTTEINILGIFVGKTDRNGTLFWLPYLTYQLNGSPDNRKKNFSLIRENLDINASLQLTMDVANRLPSANGTESPANEHTRNRFVVEIWYRNDYSDICYVKHYTVEHIPLELYTPETETAWDLSIDCHAYDAAEKTYDDYLEQCRAADVYNHVMMEAAQKRKQNEPGKAH